MNVVTLPAKNPSSPLAALSGHHVGIRVPDFAASKQWFIEKLDFRVVHEWPYADQKLAYVAPANDDHFFIEILGDGNPLPLPKPLWTDLGDSLRLAGYHHACFNVDSVEATVAELRRRGVDIVTEPFVLPAVGRKLAFFADPWGNLFELAEVVA
ncbi:VOC family protein [Duganella callida]|uniref:VOC family protein n=1 Tax=Duganella callida TaxID=2561932 RepID=A0A4Y9SEU5_9BURK|nr:VOC family protein [Duganella callida]TFW19385.1 VOC family protein [Duganella callida]